MCHILGPNFSLSLSSCPPIPSSPPYMHCHTLRSPLPTGATGTGVTPSSHYQSSTATAPVTQQQLPAGMCTMYYREC